jgi:hypothetical protein
MSIVPPIIFIASAILLFSTSRMFANADPAGQGPLRRRLMQAVVSLAVLAASLFIILTHAFDQRARYWASCSVGMVVGYWLNSK